MRIKAEKCPHCEANIEYVEVSKQIEGIQHLRDLDLNGLRYPVQWKSPENQCEEEVFTCPICLVQIEDETLKEWGLKDTE